MMKKYISLQADQENEKDILTQINSDISYKASNIWFLVIAVLICCIGLNINSTTCVIGAMLLSQIMAPMVGMGIGLGILDFGLTKKSFKNLLFAFLVSFLISLVYFYISPINLPNNEIFSRSQFNIWDGIIAFLSGVAGIIGQTRKQQIGTILPGVSLANSLLPPICVAAFWVTRGENILASKAIYLFLINFVFIVGAVFLMSGFLGLGKEKPKKNLIKKEIKYFLYFLLILVAIPAYNFTIFSIKNLYFENEIKNFDTFLNSQNIGFLESNYEKEKNTIDIYLLKNPEKEKIENIQKYFSQNKYFQNKKLNFIFGSPENPKNTTLTPNTQLLKELKTLNNNIISVDLGTENIFVQSYELTQDEKNIIQNFLIARTNIKNIIFSQKSKILEIFEKHYFFPKIKNIRNFGKTL